MEIDTKPEAAKHLQGLLKTNSLSLPEMTALCRIAVQFMNDHPQVSEPLIEQFPAFRCGTCGEFHKSDLHEQQGVGDADPPEEFKLIGTGGGCEAWEYTFSGGYAMITLSDDPQVPIRDSDAITLGVYNGESGEGILFTEGMLLGHFKQRWAEYKDSITTMAMAIARLKRGEGSAILEAFQRLIGAGEWQRD